MCQIHIQRGFHERREYLDENESLRITIFYFETRERSVREESKNIEKWAKMDFERIYKQSQKCHSQKKPVNQIRE